MKSLNKLKELHAKTTQGEWKATLDFPTDSVCCDGAVIATSIYKTSNSEFIVEAHKMVPLLIEALNECRSQRNLYLDQIFGNGFLVEKSASHDDKELEQILEEKG